MAGFSQPKSSTSLPYLLPAATGQQQTSRNQFQSAQENKKSRANDAMSRDFYAKNSGQQSGTTSFQGLQTRNLPNGNPIATGGEVMATLPNGKTLRIPNALAQQLQATAYNNEGRYDPSEFFGFGNNSSFSTATKNLQDSNQPVYTDFSVAQNRLDKFTKENPQYLQPGAINEAQRKMDRYAEIDNQIQQLNAQMTGMTQRETVDTSGRVTSSTFADTQRQLDVLKREQASRPNISRNERRSAGFYDDIMGQLSGLSGTVSNLPIKETVLS
jgi:hypothetical protein